MWPRRLQETFHRVLLIFPHFFCVKCVIKILISAFYMTELNPNILDFSKREHSDKV